MTWPMLSHSIVLLYRNFGAALRTSIGPLLFAALLI
jgi:hypothetical protein